jgi:hypothetical protein
LGAALKDKNNFQMSRLATKMHAHHMPNEHQQPLNIRPNKNHRTPDWLDWAEMEAHQAKSNHQTNTLLIALRGSLVQERKKGVRVKADPVEPRVFGKSLMEPNVSDDLDKSMCKGMQRPRVCNINRKDRRRKFLI